MTLYSINGATPRALPKQVTVYDEALGRERIRTHLDTLSEAELAALGIVPAPSRPSHDPEIEHAPVWDGSQWVVTPLTQEQIDGRAEAARQERLSREWTPVEFMRLLTQPERVAIRTAAQSDVVIEDFLDMVRAAQAVILSDSETIAGVGYLVAQGLLTQARADAILDGQAPS